MAAKKDKILKHCKNCGKEMLVYPYVVDRKNFCSRKCSCSFNMKGHKYSIGNQHWLGKKHKLESIEKIRIKKSGVPSTSYTKFKKGDKVWNKGIKWDAMSGEKHPMFGKHHTLESRKKISDNNKGKIIPEYTRKRVGEAAKGNKHRVGIKLSEEHKKRIGDSSRGDKNIHWKGGITKENHKIRTSAEYIQWRKDVFERDNYTCQHCKMRGGKLHADHIKQFAYFPELRLDINNGRTLCEDCHKKTPTYKQKKLIAA